MAYTGARAYLALIGGQPIPTCEKTREDVQAIAHTDSTSLSRHDAAASLATIAAALHILEPSIAVAVVLALAGVRPAALARVVADLSFRQGQQVGVGRAEDADGEGGETDEKLALHCV